MTDISTLKEDDRIVFSNGHESPVVNVMDAENFLNIYFVTEKGGDINLYFRKETGEAPGTHYEIVKVIRNGSN